MVYIRTVIEKAGTRAQRKDLLVGGNGMHVSGERACLGWVLPRSLMLGGLKCREFILVVHRVDTRSVYLVGGKSGGKLTVLCHTAASLIRMKIVISHLCQIWNAWCQPTC